MNTPDTPMQARHPDPVAEDELHALLDDRLPPAEHAALLARVQADPAASATLANWRGQSEALRGLHAQVLDEAVPAVLLRAAAQAGAARRQHDLGWRLAGMAAAVLLAFGLGWWSHAGMESGLAKAPAQSAGGSRLAQADQRFVRQASIAHAVYAPEARHPVEVGSAQQEHLVQWLSKRLGRPLTLPQLGAQGYELLGGRLLPGEGGARAQFMFQNAAGERVTLYLGAVAEGSTSASSQETAFRFSSEGAVQSFYWMDRGFGYALSGQLPREQLMGLAQLVYQQL
jgi:anti-sigma factor RsiW